MRTGVGPPSSSGGMAMTILVDEAKSARDGWSPTVIEGRSSVGKPAPATATRPPSTARRGLTEEMVGRGVIRGSNRYRLQTTGYRLDIVELGLPVQIIAPALRRVLQADRNADGGSRIRPAWRLQQTHPGLGGRLAALLPIAGHAAGDDVFPVLAASVGDRHHVIERQLGRGHYFAAVLAGVIVARVDVLARERNVIEPAFDLDEAEEADDGGQLEADGHCPYLAVMDRDHLYLPLAPERNRLLPVDDFQRLVRRVQEERLLHDWSNDAPRLTELSR